MEDFLFDDEEFEDEVYEKEKSVNHKICRKFKTRDKKRCESHHWVNYYVNGDRYIRHIPNRPYRNFCKKYSNKVIRRFSGEMAMRGNNYKKLYDFWWIVG
ncbi:hypothetical protein [Chryseobacterium sp.]|uniref:hypothetical protein n=1 Tax=Chryseobacterium sp. TaxID=1871047 RepID=UPI002FC5950A